MNQEVYVVDAVRTPIGSFMGSLKNYAAHQLGELVIKALLKRNTIDSSLVSEVILGQILTAGYGQNPARQAAINAGIPKEVPAYLVNLVCGSGVKSICLGAQSIALGDNSIVIAGGQESMSMAKHTAFIRNGIKMGDLGLVDSMLSDGLFDAFKNHHMGITAENIAEKYGISRLEQDEFAYNSQRKAKIAQEAGKFQDEIVPIEIHNKKELVNFSSDEFIRLDASLEKLALLKPVFKNTGTVTAGNASGINDGAAVVLMMGKDMLKQMNAKPIARVVSYATTGVDPEFMGIGPVSAVKKAVNKAGWRLDDLDLIEANEAFAAQAIAVNRELGWDVNKVNANGGAIALGHPIGASGTRIVTTLLHEMKRRKAKKALATLCIGGGMGIAICFESCV